MRKEKYKQIWKIVFIFLAVFAWAVIPFITQNKVEASDNEESFAITTLAAALLPPNGGANPRGAAVFVETDSNNRQLEVEIENISLPNGTVLTVFINGSSVGQMTVDQQKARLRLRTQDGQSVPNISSGSTIEVRNGSSTLVSGVFSSGNNPTPSPSASPSGSPTVSPTVNPSASPTVSPSASPTVSPSVSPSASPTTSPTASPTISPTVSPTASPSPNPGDLFANLTGAPVNGVVPAGFAQYELHSSRIELDVRVKQINLPRGTVLNVVIDNVTVGQIVLNNNGGVGRLRLRSDKGEAVPNVVNGSTIRIVSGNTTILSGTFSNVVPTATPSPTPSGSPSPSPSPASMGRHFEAHLTGSQVDPPVSTAATGEVKVLLHQNETRATIIAKFQNLSSAQTAARIEVLIGSTSTIVDFGAIGGTKGNFPARVIDLTPVQVQQLRAGLWSVVIASANHPNGEIHGTLTQRSDRSDFDGDGNNDLAVFRKQNGTWHTLNSQGAAGYVFGNPNDAAISADFDGDGKADRAIFRSVNGDGIWEISRSYDGGTTSKAFGLGTDTPVRGDFDGDGINDFAIFRPSNGVWVIQKSDNSGFITVPFGAAAGEDIPLATDMDGDGKADITIFRPSINTWSWIRSSDGSRDSTTFGMSGDKPLVGDFDGDGRTDISVFRPSTGVWHIKQSSDGIINVRPFGISEDLPVEGDYDGDDKTDIAIFRPSNSVWCVWRSGDGVVECRAFGASGDTPTTIR
jgi:hypothetical protein